MTALGAGCSLTLLIDVTESRSPGSRHIMAHGQPDMSWLRGLTADLPTVTAAGRIRPADGASARVSQRKTGLLQLPNAAGNMPNLHTARAPILLTEARHRRDWELSLELPTSVTRDELLKAGLSEVEMDAE
jgi:hypothetical protein